MYAPLPPDPGNLKYWNQEAKRREELARSGGLPFELLTLLWYGIRAVYRLLILPVKLYVSWRLRLRQQKARDPLDWLNKN